MNKIIYLKNNKDPLNGTTLAPIRMLTSAWSPLLLFSVNLMNIKTDL